MLANDMRDGSKFKNISSIILVDKYADFLLELPSIVGLKVIDAIKVYENWLSELKKEYRDNGFVSAKYSKEA